jgi:hypothetical protein
MAYDAGTDMGTDMGADEYDNAAQTANATDSSDEDAKLLDESRKLLQRCIDEESDERQKMLDDLLFATLDQWPQDVRASRENDVVNGPRPCLTVDQINQYITQVSNDMRVNRPAIKARPVDDGADVETAKIFQGIIRHIENRSNAPVAYQTAGDSAVTMGLGFFRVMADFVSPDSFNQELLIKRVPDTLSVYLGPHIMPDGSDANHGWVFERVPLDEFKRLYPDAKCDEADFSNLGLTADWRNDDTVRVCEYFYKKRNKATLLYLGDGSSIFEDDYKQKIENGMSLPPITAKRRSEKVSVHWCKHTGAEVLEKRDLKGRYIPIIEVVGKEKLVRGKRVLWGLVRPAKDSLRAFNYWISAMTEKMALAPKAPWIGAVGQFASQGDRWDKANINNYAKLEYDPIDVNGNALPAPHRTEPVQMEPAMAQMLGIMQNNVKSSLGMYKAAIGEAEPQQSGRAILALKRESDTGTMHFGDNQALSIAHCGRILIDLIPHYYDTAQVIRIIGDDGKAQTVRVNPDQKEAVKEVRTLSGEVQKIYNLNVGTYDVEMTTGPGYTTSRQEAATVMTELANSAKDPASAAILRYAAVKNSDFYGQEEVQQMLKVLLPPQVQSIGQGQAPIPPEAQAQMAQMQQGLQQLQAQAQQLAQENQQLKSGAQESMAKIEAQKQEKMAALHLDEQVESEKLRLQEQQQAEAARLAWKKAEDEIALKRWIAQQEAMLDRRVAGAELSLEAQSQAADQQLARENAARMADAAEDAREDESMNGEQPETMETR